MVCLDPASSGTEEESGTFFIGAGIIPNFLTRAGEVGIDLIHRDGALGHIEDQGAAVVLEEADGVRLSVLRFLEMRSNF